MNSSLILNTMQYLQVCHGLSATQSVVLFQSTLRLATVPLKYFLDRNQGMNHFSQFYGGANKTNLQDVTVISSDQKRVVGSLRLQRFYDKLIWRDFQLDMKRNKITNPDQISHYKSYYMPSSLICQLAQVWGQIEVCTAFYTIQHYPQYQPTMDGISIFCSHDPTFTLPALAIPLSYLLLNNSLHPGLINIRENWTPLAKLLASVYVSCGLIVLPQSYSIAFLSYGLMHLSFQLKNR